jgi:hypothetical protein
VENANHIDNITICFSVCSGEVAEVINNIFDKCWFILNYKRYLKFKERILKEDRNINDIWYSRKIGFICF